MDEQVDALLIRISRALAPRFGEMLSVETVDRCVRESHALLNRPGGGVAVPVRWHLPVLTERFARDRLTAMAQSCGLVAKLVPEVLFVCTRNAGRSQLAAALTAHHAAGRVHARTAGTTTATDLDPIVVQALTDEIVRAADVVITMGCGDACPLYPGKRYQDWLLDQPEGAPIERVRRIRDHIDERVRELLDELTPARQVR